MHLDVVLDRSAEHGDEISLAGRAEGDDHAPHVVLLQDPVQLAHVTEHRHRQAPPRDRVQESDRIDPEFAVLPEDSRELGADLAGAEDHGRLEQHAAAAEVSHGREGDGMTDHDEDDTGERRP